jgi:hypothetical protein
MKYYHYKADNSAIYILIFIILFFLFRLLLRKYYRYYEERKISKWLENDEIKFRNQSGYPIDWGMRKKYLVKKYESKCA